MQITSVCLIFQMAVASSAAIIAQTNLPEGYRLADMTWTGVVEKGGPAMSFVGTVQSVENQVKEINSSWTIYNQWNAPQQEKRSEVSKRYPTDLLCDVPNFSAADSSPVKEGVKYLRGLGGGCGVGARSCVRVSCSWNGAIHLCNNNDHSISPSCSYLGDLADTIVTKCLNKESNCRTGPRGQGQQWDNENFNVIVALDQC
ncbi:hypothetical protein B0T18DRAFT_393017 [Schizothecium vesticola]|uniref:Uncharacterized protein n=1 Tax=Schizothecium vesticola TaxID=314040 RepID=A0AA40EIV6_9PEZI|nr:hypothetical protein B0T18DRAFT_393017 [Schizothecium vesticola]